MESGNSKLGWIVAGLALAGGTSLSIMFYNDARTSERASADMEKTVVSLEQKVKTLEKKPRVLQALTTTVDDEHAADAADTSAEIRSMEERLRAKDEQITMLYDQLNARAGQSTNVQPEVRRSWMDDIKENDPERYKEIMDRREQARQAAKYEIAKKAAHFLERNSESMTEAEAEEYSQMMTLLSDSMNLTEQLNAELPQDQRREVMHNLRDNMRELSPLLENERGREFYRIGKDMGYSDDDATAFAAYLTDVVNLTSVQSVFRSSMRAMGGGGGGWGGWGGDGPGPRPRSD